MVFELFFSVLWMSASLAMTDASAGTSVAGQAAIAVPHWLRTSIEERLKQPITVDFRDVPLRDAVEYFKLDTELNIIFDDLALKEAGISLDSPASIAINRAPLGLTLRRLFHKYDPRLRFVIKDQHLLVTAEKAALKQAVYSVVDLVVPHWTESEPSWVRSLCPEMCQKPRDKGAARTSEQALLRYITNTVARESWDVRGGHGTLQYFPLGMALVVNQSAEVQQEVAGLLFKLYTLQHTLDRPYTLELTWVEGKGDDQTRKRFPTVTGCQGRWYPLTLTDRLDVGNGTLHDLGQAAAAASRSCVAQASSAELPSSFVDIGHDGRLRMTPVDKGRVRLDLEVRKTELEEANRDGLVVAGQAFRVVRLVQPGQAAKVVLKRDADGHPLSWLDLTVTEPPQEYTGEGERIFLGEAAPIPR